MDRAANVSDWEASKLKMRPDRVGGIMKDITGALLAILLILMSLASLIVADPIPMGKGWVPFYSSQGVHELELRYAVRR